MNMERTTYRLMRDQTHRRDRFHHDACGISDKQIWKRTCPQNPLSDLKAHRRPHQLRIRADEIEYHDGTRANRGFYMRIHSETRARFGANIPLVH